MNFISKGYYIGTNGGFIVLSQDGAVVTSIPVVPIENLTRIPMELMVDTDQYALITNLRTDKIKYKKCSKLVRILRDREYSQILNILMDYYNGKIKRIPTLGLLYADDYEHLKESAKVQEKDKPTDVEKAPAEESSKLILEGLKDNNEDNQQQAETDVKVYEETQSEQFPTKQTIKKFLLDNYEAKSDGVVRLDDAYSIFSRLVTQDIPFEKFMKTFTLCAISEMNCTRGKTKTPLGDSVKCVYGIAFHTSDAESEPVTPEAQINPEQITTVINGERYINLSSLARDMRPSISSSKTSYSGRRGQGMDPVEREGDYVFTIEDVKRLASCSPNQALQIFGFSGSRNTAIKMIRMAKTYLGKNIAKTNYAIGTYQSLMSQGFDFDQLVEMFGEDKKYSIMESYKRFQINGKTSLDDSATECKTWMELIPSMTMDELLEYEHMTQKNFAATYKMKMSHAYDILAKIRCITHHDPYVTVFGTTREHINSVFTSRQDKTFHIILSIVDQLANGYTSSLDDHAEILTGVKAIPDEVPEELRDAFIMLLRKRFTNSSFSYTNEDFDYINSHDVNEVRLKFLIPVYGTALSVQYRQRRKNEVS